jgi:zinc D-Ala-D-Ala carboxypeptidase
MQNISKHITYKEATQSATATRLKIDNIPSFEVLANMKLVAEKCFEPLREWYGKPITINSFYRSPALNKAVKGSKTSDHVKGMAIDLDTGSNAENLKLFNWLKENVEFTQLIHEYGDKNGPEWVHISYDPNNLKTQLLYIK